MLLPYFGFLLQTGYDWNVPPDRVRAHLVEFLRIDVSCQIGPAPEDGYHIETTGASPLSKSSLGVLLAALTSLYDSLADAGYYPFQNPMRSERLMTLKREHLRQVKNAGAPDHADIRSETHKETNQAYPTTFFRQKRGKVWAPEVVMEPDAVQERMRKTINYMIKQAPFQRDQIILLLLRQTGARLSEIVEMTVGGYRNAHHGGRALIRDKGSRGREEKTIYFTDVVEEQLQTYVRTERAEYDPQGRKWLEELDDTDPLFLTNRGTAYTRTSFYHHWKRLFEPAQKQFKKSESVSFSPHDIRHLRVTRGITKIKQEAKGDKGLEEELLDGFWRLMGWRSRQTMDIYTHTFNKRKALLAIGLDDDEQDGDKLISKRSETAIFQAPMQESPVQTEQRNISPLLAPGEEDFSWYEE
jgi:integrase